MSSSRNDGVYRSSAVQMWCVVCSEPANVQCRSCGCPLCTRHAPINELCPDCELSCLQLERTASGWARAAFVGAVGVGAGLIGLCSAPLAIVAGSALLLTGAVSSVLGRRVARARFHRRGQSLIEEAPLRVAPSSGPPSPERLPIPGSGRLTARGGGWNRSLG